MLGRILRRLLVIVFKLFNPRFKDAVMYDIPRVYYKNRLKLGKNVHFNDSVFINAVGEVEIGDYSVLSHGVSIISTGNDTARWTERVDDEDVHINKPIVIGKNVWLCANTTICSGVRIADNCVVAAGAVVTKNLEEPCWLYGGIPARKIGELTRK